jgi:hypothetical protein
MDKNCSRKLHPIAQVKFELNSIKWKHIAHNTTHRINTIQMGYCEEMQPSLGLTGRFYSIKNSITFKKHILNTSASTFQDNTCM